MVVVVGVEYGVGRKWVGVVERRVGSVGDFCGWERKEYNLGLWENGGLGVY